MKGLLVIILSMLTCSVMYAQGSASISIGETGYLDIQIDQTNELQESYIVEFNAESLGFEGIDSFKQRLKNLEGPTIKFELIDESQLMIMIDKYNCGIVPVEHSVSFWAEVLANLDYRFNAQN